MLPSLFSSGDLFNLFIIFALGISAGILRPSSLLCSGSYISKSPSPPTAYTYFVIGLATTPVFYIFAITSNISITPNNLMPVALISTSIFFISLCFTGKY